MPDSTPGGTFTLTNLGMFDIDGFTPLVNPSQAAILGVGRIQRRAVVLDDDRLVGRAMITLSLSFVIGWLTARLLRASWQRVRQLIERPLRADGVTLEQALYREVALACVVAKCQHAAAWSQLKQLLAHRCQRCAGGNPNQNALLARAAQRHFVCLLLSHGDHPVQDRRIQVGRDEACADALDWVRRRLPAADHR